MLQITDVRLNKVDKEGKLKAIGSITLEDAFVVHGVRVVEGNKGLFVTMPSNKLNDGSYVDVAHPINTEVRQMVNQMVLQAYEKIA